MSNRSSKSFRPGVTGLEDRVVLSASIGGLTVARPIGPIYPSPPLVPIFDTTINVNFGTDSIGDFSVGVDGSDYDDTIQVLDFQPGAGGYVKLRLQERSDGVVIYDFTATYHAGFSNMSAFPVGINAKGGDDTIINYTAAFMTALGGDGDDYFVGGPGGNAISGDAGDDAIYGGAGNDYLIGGDGDDTILAGDGIDYIDGGAGDDYIQAGGGNDTIYGDAGDDFLDGGAGDDDMQGGDGNDYVSGGAGNDKIQGDGGDDTLDGGDGDDHLEGQDGYDILYGGAGDDYLDAGYMTRNDGDITAYSPEYLEGDAGADTFVHHESLFGVDDSDHFVDYNSAQGDSTDTIWHW